MHHSHVVNALDMFPPGHTGGASTEEKKEQSDDDDWVKCHLLVFAPVGI